jgi:hypothetical protein
MCGGRRGESRRRGRGLSEDGRSRGGRPATLLPDGNVGREGRKQVHLVPRVAEDADALLEHGVVCDHAIRRDGAGDGDSHGVGVPVKALPLCSGEHWGFDVLQGACQSRMRTEKTNPCKISGETDRCSAQQKISYLPFQSQSYCRKANVV